MFLRIGVLVLGVVAFVFLGWAAIEGWTTVFTLGADTIVDTRGIGGRASEGPAIIPALVATVFSFAGAAAAVFAAVELVKSRRNR